MNKGILRAISKETKRYIDTDVELMSDGPTRIIVVRYPDNATPDQVNSLMRGFQKANAAGVIVAALPNGWDIELYTAENVY